MGLVGAGWGWIEMDGAGWGWVVLTLHLTCVIKSKCINQTNFPMEHERKVDRLAVSSEAQLPDGLRGKRKNCERFSIRTHNDYL